MANALVTDIEIDSAAHQAFLAGSFSELVPPVSTRHGAVLDKNEGWPLLGHVRPNATVRAVVDDGQGGWFIGGDFTSLSPDDDLGNTTPRNRLAHINASGEMDSSWTAGADAPIRALVRMNNTLYVGGDFTFIGGAVHNRVAAFDIPTATVIAGFNNGLTGDQSVYALDVANGVLYAGGNFTVLGGQNRTRLAALNLTTGIAESNWAPTANNTVYAIHAEGTQIYVGGSFTQISSNPKNRLAELDAAAGALSAWNPSPNATVYAMDVAGDTLIAGGDFSSIGGQSIDNIAAIQRSVPTNNAYGWNPEANNTVFAVRISGNLIYAGGSFTQVGNPITARVRAAAFDRFSTSVTEWNPSANSTIRCLALRNDAVFVGGDFTTIGFRTRGRLACINTITGKPTTWAPTANNVVLDMVLRDTILYASGYFTTMNTVTNNRICALNAQTGALIPGWAASATGQSGWVHKMVESDGILYAGGSFNTVSGYPRNRLVALNALTGAVLPNWVADADGDIYPAMLISGQRLYVGGDFQNIGVPAVPRSRIAALDKTTGAVDLTWSPGASSRVYCLLEKDGALFVGGLFTTIAGSPRNYLASIDPNTGTANPFVANANNYVYALNAKHNVLFVGGAFTVLQGQNRQRLAAIELASGTVLPWAPMHNNYPQCIARLGSQNETENLLLVGGEFSTIDSEARDHFAAWIPDDEVNSLVQNITVANSIVVYPNPTNGELFISNKGGLPIERMLVINTMGQVIHDERPTATDRYTLDLSNAANGLYTVRISQGASTTALPVMVQH